MARAPRGIMTGVWISARATRVVYNGISLPPNTDASSPRSRPYVLYACRLEHPGKNHVRLLEAFARSSLRETRGRGNHARGAFRLRRGRQAVSARRGPCRDHALGLPAIVVRTCFASLAPRNPLRYGAF